MYDDRFDDLYVIKTADTMAELEEYINAEQGDAGTGRFVVDGNRVYDTWRKRYLNEDYNAIRRDGKTGKYAYGVVRSVWDADEAAGERWYGDGLIWSDPEEAILARQEECGISALYYE